MYTPIARDLPGLDGLRGFAAILVLVSHSAGSGYLPDYLGGGLGQAGVSIFYVLSGFLMAHVTFGREFESANVLTYIRDRGSRVLPLFYAIVIANTLLFAVIGEAFYAFNTWADAASNLALYKGTSVLWSIPVEIHFYGVFLLVWWAYRRGLFWLAIGVLLVAQVILLPWASDDRTLVTWLHFFILGIAMRWLFDTGSRNILPVRIAPALIGWAGLIALALMPPQIRVAIGLSEFENYLDPYIIVLAPILLWFAAAQVGPFKIFATPVLRWYGKISFSFYLLHALVLTVMRRFELDYGVWSFVGALAVTSLISAISFHVIESPSQRIIRSRWKPRERLAVGA